VGRRSKKRHGNFCWCCGRVRPNEAFSGKNHSRHICRECARLGGDELEYRQAQRNLERAVTWEGLIRRRQRHVIEAYRSHDNARVRELVEQILADDRALRTERAEIARLYDQDLEPGGIDEVPHSEVDCYDHETQETSDDLPF
jgi:hypothetical protein